MNRTRQFACLVFVCLACGSLSFAQNKSAHAPTWWAKYEYLSKNGASTGVASSSSLSVGSNVDVSNECGPQSETYVTLNPSHPKVLAGGSNEIFRDPMRGYSSTDGGSSWDGVDLPLPPPLQGTNDTRFGSDPSLAFDTHGNLFYSYIVVFFGNGSGVDGSEMAVAHSTDGGKSYPQVTYFDFQSGSNHFNDKPMITTDTNTSSRFRDNVYVAWDSSSGGSATAGGIHVARSSDAGATYSIARVDNPSGPGQGIGAVPFVGPNGEVYVAWNDYQNNVIAFNRSFDGGVTWGAQNTVAAKTAAFDVGIPSESFRRALVYSACDADRSSGPHRGRLYCSWMDITAAGVTDILVSHSDDRGATWTAPLPVTDQLPHLVDRFNQWLSADPITGDLNLSFYDTRNDTTGFRYMTDTYFSQSNDGGFTFRSPNTRVSSVSSNEHDCSGLFPCSAIDYGNQQGDYEGLVSYGGISHPIWTDSRLQTNSAPACRTNLSMEEVFTSTVN
ncbi:MAG: hypothetical protein PVS2B2_12290 [Candidatus Acidiferrum sp.]